MNVHVPFLTTILTRAFRTQPPTYVRTSWYIFYAFGMEPSTTNRNEIYAIFRLSAVGGQTDSHERKCMVHPFFVEYFRRDAFLFLVPFSSVQPKAKGTQRHTRRRHGMAFSRPKNVPQKFSFRRRLFGAPSSQLAFFPQQEPRKCNQREHTSVFLSFEIRTKGEANLNPNIIEMEPCTVIRVRSSHLYCSRICKRSWHRSVLEPLEASSRMRICWLIVTATELFVFCQINEHLN